MIFRKNMVCLFYRTGSVEKADAGEDFPDDPTADS